MLVTGSYCAGFIDARERFQQSLQAAGVNRPDSKVVDYIQLRLSSRLLACCNNVDAACALYREGQQLPGSATASLLLEQGLRINGPFSETLPASILTGVKGGQPCIVKLLPLQVPSLASLTLSSGTNSPQKPPEAVACEKLNLSAAVQAGVPLVDATVVTVQLPQDQAHVTRHGPGVYTALCMPQYARVLSDMPQLPEDAILKGAQRMVQAVEYVHQCGLRHMDIKVGTMMFTFLV